jgi:arylsulfatase A-like enzyme
MKPIRLLICVVVAVAAVQLTASAQQRALPRRSNIILIVADGLGVGDLSCYGQTEFQTPNLDKLAADGIRFTHYSAGSTNSSLASATLMLGDNTSAASADTDATLTGGDTTIAELLKSSGYYTCLIGKWGLGDENSAGAPWLQGFDEFIGYFRPADIDNMYADFVWRYQPDPYNNGSATPLNRAEEIYENTGGNKSQYIPDRLAKASVNFANNHKPAKFTGYRPFFLVVNYTVPGDGNRAVPSDAPFSEESWPQSEKNRAALISRLDGYIGDLLQELNKIGQATNTAIFFTSDTIPQKANGVDPKFFHENDPSKSLRVPMIVCWPGKIPAGQVSDLACSARDVLPTVSAVGLVRPPEKIQGVSFLPAMLQPGMKWNY